MGGLWAGFSVLNAQTKSRRLGSKHRDLRPDLLGYPTADDFYFGHRRDHGGVIVFADQQCGTFRGKRCGLRTYVEVPDSVRDREVALRLGFQIFRQLDHVEKVHQRADPMEHSHHLLPAFLNEDTVKEEDKADREECEIRGGIEWSEQLQEGCRDIDAKANCGRYEDSSTDNAAEDQCRQKEVERASSADGVGDSACIPREADQGIKTIRKPTIRKHRPCLSRDFPDLLDESLGIEAVRNSRRKPWGSRIRLTRTLSWGIVVGVGRHGLRPSRPAC
jgi:hypothetical protein